MADQPRLGSDLVGTGDARTEIPRSDRRGRASVGDSAPLSKRAAYLLKRTRRLPVGNKALLLETLALLAVFRAAVLLVPFRWLARFLGKEGEARPVPAAPECGRRIRRIGAMVHRVSQHVPWTSKCLDQALAAKVLLARRGISATVYFGVKKDDRGELMAHAWLRSGTIYVTGEKNHAEYAVINIFTNEGA